MRILRGLKRLDVFIGPWQIAFQWAWGARFANGSRWCSGIHRWEDEDF